MTRPSTMEAISAPIAAPKPAATEPAAIKYPVPQRVRVQHAASATNQTSAPNPSKGWNHVEAGNAHASVDNAANGRYTAANDMSTHVNRGEKSLRSITPKLSWERQIVTTRTTPGTNPNASAARILMTIVGSAI